MTRIDIDDSSVIDWENYFFNRTNTREISGHGGGNYVSSQLARIVAHPDCVRLYGLAVQAVLDRWNEFDAIQRDPYEVNPIHSVAHAAFGFRGANKPLFIEDLRPQYNRLWLESPRPFTDTHKIIALNSRGQIPLSALDIELLFEQDGWGMVATRVASEAGHQNLTITLMNKLYEREAEISTSSVVKVVEMGFPKLKGLRWLYMMQNYSDYTKAVIERWQNELLDEGAPEKDIILPEQ
jgi:hypothetical protein